MARTIRCHLDEHVDPDVADGLRRRGADVTTTAEANLLATSDAEQLAYLRATGRVLFTEDADFLRMHAAGQSHAGIVFCHQQSRLIGDIIRGLLLVWEALEPAERADHVEYL